MRSSATKTYEIGDLEYEVAIDYFHPGSPPSYWEPGDGPEVSAAPTVDVSRDGKRTGTVSYDEFLELLRPELEPGVDAADHVEEALIEAALEAMED